jgi:hypothetical protein
VLKDPQTDFTFYFTVSTNPKMVFFSSTLSGYNKLGKDKKVKLKQVNIYLFIYWFIYDLYKDG